MASTAADQVASYLVGLPATNAICSNLGTRLVFGTNLFIAVEATSGDCVVVTPYGGAAPVIDRFSEKFESTVQVRLKMTDKRKVLSVMQDIINDFHNNDNIVTKGIVWAIQSSPILLGIREGGESAITVSNYIIKHVKF